MYNCKSIAIVNYFSKNLRIYLGILDYYNFEFALTNLDIENPHTGQEFAHVCFFLLIHYHMFLNMMSNYSRWTSCSQLYLKIFFKVKTQKPYILKALDLGISRMNMIWICQVIPLQKFDLLYHKFNKISLKGMLYSPFFFK